MEVMLLDTSFLVDWEREARRASEGSATLFLKSHPTHRFVINVVIAGELAAGASLSEESVWEEFLAPFRILPLTRRSSWLFGRISHFLRSKGTPIGSNDAWIAANAMEHALPVVSANADEFSRVPDLRVVEYR